jgi:hypothetical protein
MIYLFILISTLLHTGIVECTSFGSTTTKDLKQPVNFSGKLTTHQGQEYIVDNISIDNRYKQIPMYAKPMSHANPVMNNDTKQMEIKLSENPASDFVKGTVDLDELGEIQVPSPNTIWYYQKKERQQKIEYIEVVIITKSKTKNYYLLERKTPVYCDEIDTAGPQEKTIPLSALRTLTIEGYTYRDTSKDKKNSEPQCPPCPAEKK